MGETEDFAERHPTTAVLIVEVSDTTLRFDMGSKASLYAEAGIEEYWVLDVVNRQLVAFRNPIDGDYAERREYEPGASLAPLSAPEAMIAVAELLP